jgi:DME family drug/metabolite transporter
MPPAKAKFSGAKFSGAKFSRAKFSGANVAVLAVLGAAALFGTSATAATLLVPDASPQSVAGWRLLVGALGLIVVTRGWAFAFMFRIPLIWLMGLSVGAFQFFFFLSANLAGVAMGTLVTISAAPWFAGLLGWVWGAGRPSRIWWISTVIGIGGVFLLVGTPASGSINVGGVLAGLAAAASYAVMTNVGTKLTQQGKNPNHVLAASFSIGAILLIPFIITGGAWFTTASGIVLILWLGLFVTTLAYVLFGLGLKNLMPGTIATLNLGEPLVATILAVWLLDESLSTLGWVGCILILLALALLARASTSTAKANVEERTNV